MTTAGRARRERTAASAPPGSVPLAELRIVETRVFRGPNYWNYDPAIKLVVDLGILEHFPTNTIPGFSEALLEMLPGVGHHTCGTGRVGGGAGSRQMMVTISTSPISPTRSRFSSAAKFGS